jgi:PAS domain S-box-containing protein
MPAEERDRRTAPEERFDEETTPCGHLSTLPDGTIVSVNRTFLDWTGFTREELLDGRTFADLLTAGGRIYNETHYAPLLAMQGVVEEIAFEIRCPGRRLPVFVNSSLQRDAQGQPVLIRTAVFRASGRKRYEQELLDARNLARTDRARLAKLQRLTAAFVGRQRPDQIAQAIVTELADVTGVAAVEVVLPPRHDEPARVVGQLPPSDAPVQLRIALEQHTRAFGELVLRAPEPLTLDAGEQSLIEACAQMAAQALERAALHEQTAEVALTLQRSMLERVSLPEDRVLVGACYRPAEDELVVGGDWYDIFPLDRGRLGVVVGDVVGRGIEAATAMGQLRSAARALAIADDASPTSMLAGLDRFVDHLPRAQMATLVYAELDLGLGRLTYACAGHPPPVLTGTNGLEVLWQGRSTPIGVPPASGPRPQATVDFPVGGRLLLYTDGLIERRRETLDDGIARLCDAVTRHGRLDPDAMVTTLADELTAGEQRRDDVCLACLQRR